MANDPRGSAFNTAPIQARPKPKPKGKYKAPPGFKLVKQPNGKYKLVKIGTATGAKPATKPVVPGAPKLDPAAQFVKDEVDRQIAQDLGLTKFVDTETGLISKQMSDQANAAATVAGQFAPTTAYANPTLDANAQARVAADAGLTNAVGQDQAGALAGLIAKSGSAGADLMGNMRGALQLQHRDYGRQLEGLRPGLEVQRRDELDQRRMAAEAHRMQMATQRMQNQLAKDEFGLQVAGFNADQSSAAAGAAAEAAGEAPKPGRYGFGEQYDEPITAVIADWQAGIKQTQDPKTGTILDAKYKQPWRDLFGMLRGIAGLNADQAALLATRSSQSTIKNAKTGAWGVFKMLRGRGVSEKVQAFIIKKYFGEKAWKQLRSGPAYMGSGAKPGSKPSGGSSSGGSNSGPGNPPVPGAIWTGTGWITSTGQPVRG